MDHGLNFRIFVTGILIGIAGLTVYNDYRGLEYSSQEVGEKLEENIRFACIGGMARYVASRDVHETADMCKKHAKDIGDIYRGN